MKFNLLHFFILALSISLGMNAQYTDYINSSKPGKAETAYPVGTNVLQFENNLGFGDFKQRGENIDQKYLKNELTIRYGKFTESLEIKADIEYFNIRNKPIGNNSSINGLKKVSLGAKYKILKPLPVPIKKQRKHKKSWNATYDFKRRIAPTISVMVNVNLPFSNPQLNGRDTSLGIGIIAQNNFTPYWTIINQFSSDFIGSDRAEVNYSLSNTYNFSSYFSVFGEFNYLLTPNYSYPSFLLGMACAINNDFQIHGYTGFTPFKETSELQLNVGLSYRIDNHVDKWAKIPKKLKKENDSIAHKKITFLKKLKNVFKKKKEEGEEEAASDDSLENTDTNQTAEETPSVEKKKGFFQKVFNKKKNESEEIINLDEYDETGNLKSEQKKDDGIDDVFKNRDGDASVNKTDQFYLKKVEYENLSKKERKKEDKRRKKEAKRQAKEAKRKAKQKENDFILENY